MLSCLTQISRPCLVCISRVYGNGIWYMGEQGLVICLMHYASRQCCYNALSALVF